MVKTNPGQHVDHVVELQQITNAMANHDISDRARQEIIRLVNSKRNLQALDAHDNRRKAVHVRRALKNRLSADTQEQRAALTTTLRGIQALRKTAADEQLSRTTKNVLRDVEEDITSFLNGL